MRCYAFVDVDHTIVDGNLGKEFAKELLKRGPRKGVLKDKRRFLLYLIKSVHIALLYPFSFLYPVYVYLQDTTTDRFLDLVRSWDPKEAERVARSVAEHARIPDAAISFLRKLYEKGYTIVLISASPSIVLKHLVERLPVPVSFVGIDEDHPYPMTRDEKARIILSEFGDGKPCIVVGNPKREPFWLAREKAIVVRSPNELGRWLGF